LPDIVALLEASALPTVGVAESLDGFIVAEGSNDVVGVVGIEACSNRYALLRSAAVAADWRGRGVGGRLVARAIAEAKADGIEALYLLTTTAERYFPIFGFSETARDTVPDAIKKTEEFRSACPASATVMTLLLVEPSTPLRGQSAT
jgi:amino-acid N-acetyltransferase